MISWADLNADEQRLVLEQWCNQEAEPPTPIGPRFCLWLGDLLGDLSVKIDDLSQRVYRASGQFYELDNE